MAEFRESHDHAPEDSASGDPIEAGLRALFRDDPAATADEPHKSVACILGETLGMVSQISLQDVQDGSSPVVKPHAGAKADVPPQVGRYHLLGELARGGVGSVFKARDEDIGRDVALKVLLNRHAGNPHMTQRFVEEAQIGGQLQHPGIVPVHELGVYAGKRPYIAMKLVKGQTLARLLENRKDPAQERQRFLGIFEQICQPVAYAHARGVIHRDLKPSNVMVGAFGEVQVMDWGMAKVVRRGGARDDDRATMAANTVSIIETARTGSSAADSVAGSVVGTLSYMPPEQARGLVNDVDERSDVFGLGAILCEILTGHPPYTGRTAEELHRQARKAYLDDALSRLDACDADAEVIDLARRCLAAEPKDRPRDAGAVAASVAAYLDSLAEKAKASQIDAARAQIKAREERKARRLTAALAGAVVIAVIATAGGYLWVERERREVALHAAVHFQSELTRAETLAEQAANLGPAGRDLWAAAAEAVETVNGLVTDGVDDDDQRRLAQLGEEVDRQTRNHRLIARLEVIRDQATYAGVDHAYAAAFRELLGSDITDLSPDAVKETILETGIATELAVALDDWAVVRRRTDQPWREIADASMAVDPTPWRVLMWSAVEKGDPKELEEFSGTLRDNDAPTACLCTLADSLHQEGKFAAAETLLRQALRNDPSSYRANCFLGNLLADPRVGRYAESFRYLFAARAIRPYAPFFQDRLAMALLQAGESDNAMQVFISIVRTQIFTWQIDSILTLLENEDASLADATLDDLRWTIQEQLAEKGAHPRLWEVLGATLARRYGQEEPERALEVAVREVQRTGRQNPYVLNMLARVQYAAGERHNAIRSLEEAVAQHDPPPDWLRLLGEYRRSVLPELVSYASIDDALVSEASIGEDAFRPSNQAAFSAYLDARRLQLSGDCPEAMEKLHDVLALDRSRAEPFLRLVECLREIHGPQQASRVLAEELKEGLPEVLLCLPAQVPRELHVRLDAERVQLLASPFEHLDPRMEHAWTRWEIREEDGQYRRNPVIDIVSSDNLTSLSLPNHRLRPSTTYLWRVAYTTGTGQTVLSKESAFATPDYEQQTVPLDLGRWLNRDVVVNPGDIVNGTVDGSDAALLTDGYDGSSPNPEVHGLPVDRRVGIHRLGDYDKNNSLQIALGETKPLRISVPDREYVAIRLLVASGWGDAEIPVRFEYADGTAREDFLNCQDWGDDPGDIGWGGRFRGSSVPIMNGMHRLFNAQAQDYGVALFEVSLDCDPQKKLKAIVLDPRRMTGSLQGEAERTHFNLFAATGVCAEVEPKAAAAK